jgi:hypothetical protein
MFFIGPDGIELLREAAREKIDQLYSEWIEENKSKWSKGSKHLPNSWWRIVSKSRHFPNRK